MPTSDNICFVGVQGDDIVVQWPTRFKLTKDQALNLAAWIVVLVNDDEDKFDALLESLRST